MEGSNRTLLKIVSVLFLIFGVFSVILAIIGIIGGGLIAAAGAPGAGVLAVILGIGVQTPDFISPYFSINAAKA